MLASVQDAPPARREPRFSRPDRDDPTTPPPSRAGGRAPVPRRRDTPHRRAVALAGLIGLSLAGGAAAAMIGDNGNNHSHRTAATTKHPAAAATHTKKKPAKRKPAAKQQSTPTTPTTPATPNATSTPAVSTPAPPPSSGSTDNRSAVQLNNAGYAMLPGNPQGALPLIQRAVEKFRAQGDRKSINYAYSLYNLGWALQLSGRPADAIPYLQERLRISNYARGTVQRLLRLCEKQAGKGGKKKG
jgi:serine/threonine-protein kinase